MVRLWTVQKYRDTRRKVLALEETLILSSKRLHDLHRLAKKQTILVGVTVLSSWIIWFGSALYNGKMIILCPLDCILNCLSVWLTFNFSQKYWDFIDGKCCKCKFWNRFASSSSGDDGKREMMKSSSELPPPTQKPKHGTSAVDSTATGFVE